MPGKRKPNKGLLKRIRFTAKGKAKKNPCGKSHLMSGKSGKKRRQLRKANLVPGTQLKKFQRMAGMR